MQFRKPAQMHANKLIVIMVVALVVVVMIMMMMMIIIIIIMSVHNIIVCKEPKANVLL